MSRILTSIVGAVVEAAQELRIHRGRVILSLIGVGVAVCALTSMVGMSSLAAQAQTESQERYGGRDGSGPMLRAATNQELEVTQRKAWGFAGLELLRQTNPEVALGPVHGIVQGE